MWGLMTFHLAALGALHVDSYTNAALSGKPSTASLASLDFTLLSFAGGSAEVSGKLAISESSYYAFDCSFEGGQLVFVWIDDHLVCHTDPPFSNAPGSTDGSPENPLQYKSGDSKHVLVHVFSASGAGAADSGDTASVRIKWSRLERPMGPNATLNYEDVPASALSNVSSPLELQRRKLQRKLASGWNLWGYNLLGLVKLPESHVLTLGLCQRSSGACLTETRIEDTHATVRVGPYATNASYLQMYIAFKGINVSISVAGGSGPLQVLVEPLDCAPARTNCSDYTLVVMPRFGWFRPGKLLIDSTGRITLTPHGFGPTVVQPTAPATAVWSDAATRADGQMLAAPPPAPHATFELTAPVGLREGGGAAPTVGGIQRSLAAAREAELARYAAYGELAEVKEALQAAVMWNYIYTPAEYGPTLPVSRSWNFVVGAANADWRYVVFDWDNLFASYMASLDPNARDLAFSNLIQVVRSRTARGFVPNFSAGGTKSVDRTEPPIGAKVLCEMHKKYGADATWLVALLFDDLLAWNDWMADNRAHGPLGLISLGSDTIAGFGEWSPGTMQGARYESGLDNSPMYDGELLRRNVSAVGSLTINQMALYDVGFASMFVQEAECLAALAPLAGRSEEASRLTARAAAQRALIQRHLWDEKRGIFVNKFWNGSFYPRITPTSFYAMLARAASDEQAGAMVSRWLLSPEHFCIAKEGDFVGNHDDCYWGLPSIQRSDAAFPPLGYWRGYVWGPMAMLTYWSLQAYDHVPIVRTARKALCKQMTAMMLGMWRRHRHVCENFNPHRNATECSGTKFYHWGALAGMISMVEAGKY